MLRSLLPLALLLLPFSAGTASAQAPGANFKPLLTTGNPPPRRFTPGTSDDDHMYVFGGMSGATGTAVLNDLWSFDGVAWTQMTANGAPGSPPARAKAAVAWNYGKQRLMVFGGEDSTGGVFGDTWEWDPITNTWADVTPTGASPSARTESALTQDYASGFMLLFGGQTSSVDHSDTWQFDGFNWTEVNLGVGAVVPKARHGHTLCGRIDMGDSVLSQGYAYSGGYQKSSYSWNSVTWTEIPIIPFNPSGSIGMDSTYDRFRKRMVLVGGGDVFYNGDIFELKSEDDNWDPHVTDPAIGKVREYALAYVPNLGKSYKFGGTSDTPATPGDWTYEYQTDLPASLTASGSGCAGTGAVLDLTAGDLPWLGLPTTATLTGAGAGELGFMMVGFDATSWLGLPLPMDMGAMFGAPGCTLYLAPYDPLLTFLGSGPGPLTFTGAIPSSSSYAGVNFYLQGLAFDVATSGFATSQLLSGTIGKK